MTATKWMVVMGGLALIALINWYFFFAERPVTTDGAPKLP